MAVRSLPKDKLNECLAILCQNFNIPRLHDDQTDALVNFLLGKDVFISKPTGSGKSVIFQMAPFAEMTLARISSDGPWKAKAILIVICPLVSLMKDQVKQMQNIGISAAHVGSDQAEPVLRKVEEGHFTLVYMSPESSLDSDRFRAMLTNDVYSNCLMGVAVDEVHCVTQWGLSNNRERAAFRKWYSRLNELRSLTQGIPIMALTATATEGNKRKIYELLELNEPFEVVACPNRNNICYVVQKMDNGASLSEQFESVILGVKMKGKECMRTIIYCQTVFQCSLLFSLLTKELGNALFYGHKHEPEKRMVEMMHSQTPTNVKEHILDQFSRPDGHLRILIATIAYGMGVNCKGVRRVIHFGPSTSVEAYVQESGRCGRDGEDSVAVLLYNGITIKAADDNMKCYIRETTCRRAALFKHFEGAPGDRPFGHQCCDVCAAACTCINGHDCDIDLLLPIGKIDEDENDSHPVRNVSYEQKHQLKMKLESMHKNLLIANVSLTSMHVAYPTTLMQFGKYQVGQLLENCEKIFTLQDTLKLTDIWQRKHAISILKIIKVVFKDVEISSDSDSADSDAEDESNEANATWNQIAEDKSFLSLINQSDWSVSSFSMDQDTLDADAIENIPTNVKGFIQTCMEVD